MKKSRWVRHGILNTIEHGITRVADSLATLILLWTLAPETFSKLALAQALVAPALLFFVSPEGVFYRDLNEWRKKSIHSLAEKIRIFRRFAWGKAQFAIVLALLLAWLIPGESEFSIRFWAISWALSLALAPQVAGTDREFLRLELDLKALNAINLFQKLSLLIGTATVATLLPGRIDALAWIAMGSLIATALLARARVETLFKQRGAKKTSEQNSLNTMIATIGDALRSYSIWTHLSGIGVNWVLTMDLFFLGVFHYAARDVGLYATGLKLANFTYALPFALGNLFLIWVGRRTKEEGQKREKKEILRWSTALFLICILQSTVLYLLSPWLMDLLSRGRWTSTEIVAMRAHLKWILIGASIFSSSLLLSSWLFLRRKAQRLVLQAYVPWVILAVALYAWAAQTGDLLTVAQTNVVVGASHWAFLLMYIRKIWVKE